MQQFPVSYKDNKSYGQLLNDIRFYVQALGFDTNINSPQFMSIIEPGIFIESPGGHNQPDYDQPDFINFFFGSC